jgi:8-amino-7-oxononanoate synthase
MNHFVRRLEEFLRKQEELNLTRSLHPISLKKEGKIYFNKKEYIDFSSNDYLGLSNHPYIKEVSKKALEDYGTSTSASRLLSGDLAIFHQLEAKVAEFKGKEKALVFNSGYQANLGVISSLCQKNIDAIFFDRLCHASIIDGVVLSGARFFRFNHNDMNHLEILLQKERNKFKGALIITETIFSMDGDRCDLKALVELKEKYDCKLYVDEAHATGIFGESASGVVEEEGLVDKVDIIMGTFSKALGSFGAYIASSKEIINYLINQARSFIYSTALPPCVIAANLASLELLEKEPYRRKILLENADYFRKELKNQGLKVKGSSQIVPLVIGDTAKTVKLAQKLKNKGYWVFPIRPPTVPKGEDRLRFSLTYYHTKEILKDLISSLIQ